MNPDALDEPCCHPPLTLFEPFETQMLGWILKTAEERGVDLVAVQRVDDQWLELPAEHVLTFPGTCTLLQRMGCRGIRTRLEFNEGDLVGGLMPATLGPDPKAWRVLLLEALVIAGLHESGPTFETTFLCA